jgi:hypothetical protein
MNKSDTVCMRDDERSHIGRDSWTGRLIWMGDVHAILCIFMSHPI